MCRLEGIFARLFTYELQQNMGPSGSQQLKKNKSWSNKTIATKCELKKKKKKKTSQNNIELYDV